MYFSSLAELYNRKQQKRVVFLHVPIEHGSEDIEHGIDVASRIIEAMIDDLDASATDAEGDSVVV